MGRYRGAGRGANGCRGGVGRRGLPDARGDEVESVPARGVRCGECGGAASDRPRRIGELHALCRACGRSAGAWPRAAGVPACRSVHRLAARRHRNGAAQDSQRRWRSGGARFSVRAAGAAVRCASGRRTLRSAGQRACARRRSAHARNTRRGGVDRPCASRAARCARTPTDAEVAGGDGVCEGVRPSPEGAWLRADPLPRARSGRTARVRVLQRGDEHCAM